MPTPTMAQKVDEHRATIEQEVKDYKERYAVENEGKEPSGRRVTNFRRSVEARYVGLGDLISELIKLGDPNSVVSSNKNKVMEHERLIKEINTREQWIYQQFSQQ